ncbi:MAG: hypothetical protein HKL90_10180, partial [Elusimicrobia bacterium]|nr:hypothetical protein [Elusimicrobiota bacterium]
PAPAQAPAPDIPAVAPITADLPLASTPSGTDAETAAEGEEKPFAAYASAPERADYLGAVNEDVSVSRSGEKASAIRPTAAGQIGGAIRNFAPYASLQALMSDPRMAKVSADVRRPIDVKKSEIDGKRGELIASADKQDTAEDGFEEEGRNLGAEKQTLAAAVADIDRLIAAHNARCNPAPDAASYQRCLADAARINAERDRVNARVDDYNKRANAHNSKIASLQSSRETLVSDADGWAEKIKELIAEIEKILAESKDCTDELKQTVKKICNEPHSCNGLQDCDELRLNLKIGQTCLAAREKVEELCPPNEYDHKTPINNEKAAIERCENYMKDKNCDEAPPVSSDNGNLMSPQK